MSCRIAVRFAVDGDLRFLSHQDTMRLLERAAVRAGAPLRWGQGFNPRPRLSLPLPRPVGVASEDELLVLELDSPACDEAAGGDQSGPGISPGELLRRLAGELPDGIRLLGARVVRAMPQPESVRYRLDLSAGQAGDDLAGAIRELQDKAECVVQRQIDDRGTLRAVDIRPFVRSMEWDGLAGRLTVTLAVTPGGTARPAEVLAVLGLDAPALGHRMVREQVEWRLPGPERPAEDNKGV